MIEFHLPLENIICIFLLSVNSNELQDEELSVKQLNSA